MRTLMVLGGPRHGEWWGIADHIHNVRAYEDDLERWPDYRKVTLIVQWMLAPGWRIALPFLVHQDLMRGVRVQVSPGTVMPGWIEDSQTDAWPIRRNEEG